MYHLRGLRENLETYLLLIKPYLKASGSFKKAYASYLKSIHMEIPPYKSEGVYYVTDYYLLNKYSALFNQDSELNDIDNQIEVKNDPFYQDEVYGKIKSHLSLLKRIDPDLHGFFHLVVNALFCSSSKVAGGGTTSAAIGIIWADIRPTWSFYDILEFLLHEMTHTLMFLDERRFVHYRNLKILSDKENFFSSAILATKRPLDKVIHSIVVGTEILLLRQRLGSWGYSFRAHPPSQILWEKTYQAIQEVKNSAKAKKLLTRRSLFLLNQCDMALEEMEKNIPQRRVISA